MHFPDLKIKYMLMAFMFTVVVISIQRVRLPTFELIKVLMLIKTFT